MEKQTSVDVTQRTAIIVEMLNNFDAGLRSEINTLASVFGSNFSAGSFQVDPTRATSIAGGSIPLLVAGTNELNLNFSFPDRFTEQTGGVATIFVKNGEDFYRVSTSLRNDKGERVIGTILNHASPAYNKLINGTAYVGNTTLFGKQYMTRYDPVKDKDGQVVGVLFVGLDFTKSIAQIKSNIRAMKLGDSGYFYALDAEKGKDFGTLVVHPSKEGQNILASKDQTGRPFIQEMMEKKEGFIRYPWINEDAGETKSRDKIVAFLPMKNWNWIVAGGMYSDEYARDTKKLILLCGLVGILLLLTLGFALYWLLDRRVSRPLKTVVSAANKLATGDLTTMIKVTGKDEVGQLMAAVAGIGEGLIRVVNDVRESTALIARSSREIADGNADLAIRTASQASSLEETAASMHQLSATVANNSENADNANQLVIASSDLAKKGGDVVSEVISTMSSIKDSSRKIVEIIAVIDGIAFQTNILALNAAVEAARAGEQGRGFAVVASEVRQLAQRSASAAKEIKVLIDDSVSKVNAGNLLAERTEDSMRDIVDSVGQVAVIIREITSASHEQTSGIKQVNQAVIQMDNMTQNNAALVDQSSLASNKMHEQTAALVKAVAVFQIPDDQLLKTDRDSWSIESSERQV